MREWFIRAQNPIFKKVSHVLVTWIKSSKDNIYLNFSKKVLKYELSGYDEPDSWFKKIIYLANWEIHNRVGASWAPI